MTEPGPGKVIDPAGPKPLDEVHGLAHSMPERKSVWWACQSSRKVDHKLNPEEKSSVSAAEAWVKNPTPETKAAAGTAAAKTDFKGPGGWAAQAAAWSNDPGTKAGAGTAGTTPAAPGLTAKAVSGSVLLSAGLAERPAMEPPNKPKLEPAPQIATSPAAIPGAQIPAVDQSKLAKPLEPFIALGKDVQSGKNSWT